METIKIAAYTRISVDTELDKDNTSIENQKAIISENCKLHFPTSSEMQLFLHFIFIFPCALFPRPNLRG